jgi:hypothetical protein
MALTQVRTVNLAELAPALVGKADKKSGSAIQVMMHCSDG